MKSNIRTSLPSWWKKGHVTFLLILLSIVIACPVALAHPGGLDSSGGHKDKKNASGLGSYHYHCGDYPPHTHGPSGLCPYSAAHKEYKAAVDELKALADKVEAGGENQSASEVLTGAEIERMEALLLSKYMPFRLSEELLNAEGTMFGETNVKGLNIRKKQSTGSAKVGTLSVTGSVVLIKEDMGNGWYSILAHKDGKNYQGYLKADLVDTISKADYLIGLCEQLRN